MRLPFTYKIQDLLVRNNFEALEKNEMPQFQAYLNTTSGSIFTLNTFVKVPYDTLEVDFSDGAFSLTSDDFTCKEPGTYLFSGGAMTSVAPNDGIRTLLSVFKNGAEYRRLSDVAQGAAQAGVRAGAVPLRLKKGDVVDIRFNHNQAATTFAALGSSAGIFCYLHGVWLSP